jgi:drug/metabolite transporter (DMT)-like permease
LNTSSSSSRQRLGFWFALLGAIAFAGKAILVKLMLREGVDPITTLGLRMLMAAPLFALMALRGRAEPSASDVPQESSAPRFGMVALLGFSGYYLASTLDFLGLALITASLERLILYVYPTLVLLIGRLRGGPPVRRQQWIALAISYAGVFIAFGAEAKHALSNTGDPHAVLLGGALVLASAVAYAVYIALSGEIVGRYGALRLTGLASGVASTLCIAQFALLRPQLLATLPDWMTPRIFILSAINATVCTVMPMWMVMRGIQLIGSGTTAQIGMVGPLSTMLLAVALLGERLTWPIVVGTVLVLLGIGWLSQRPRAVPV